MMQDAIKEFAGQFAFKPRVQNPSKKRFKKFIVAGMGGSHLGADLIKIIDPSLDLMIHSSYGLPPLQKDQWKDRLVIASSYSGNTEETIDAFFEARKKKLPLAAVSVGGKLRIEPVIGPMDWREGAGLVDAADHLGKARRIGLPGGLDLTHTHQHGPQNQNHRDLGR